MSNDKWSIFHANQIKNNYPSWPVEVMVKVLFGNYMKKRPDLRAGMSMLDIGCGFGNNILPFYAKGFKCHGIELNDEIIKVTKDALDQKGITNVILKAGHNRSIPFEDCCFDLVISNNVIHYESIHEQINEAFTEYARVLKKGGVLFMMTVAPEHDIYKKAKVLGPHQYQIQDYDFRDGQRYFYFDNLKYLESYLEGQFKNIELGHVIERLMTVDLGFFVAVAQK